jgi:hypothetical protein
LAKSANEGDHDDIHLAGLHVIEKVLENRAVGIAAREAARLWHSDESAGMDLAASIRLRGIVLSIERIEVVVEPLVVNTRV